MQKVQLAWAYQGKKIKHIDEVENGIKCNCTCPQCEDKLIARNRGKIKSSHFAHSTDIFCEGAEETAIHLAAKYTIATSNEILTPAFNFKQDEIDELSENTKFKFGSVSNRRLKYEETQLEATVRNFRPDVIIIKGGIRIHIEITVTNKPKKSKIFDFQKNGDLLFEIDLDTEKRDFSREEFVKAVLYGKNNRRWLVLSKYDYASEYQQLLLPVSRNSNPFSDNPIEFTRVLNSKLKRYNKKVADHIRQFVGDLDELNQATNKEWREERLVVLKRKYRSEILRLKKNKTVDSQYFAPRISNIWALNVHSHIWQSELVNRFIFNQKYNRSIYFNEVVTWLQNNYSLVPFLERLNNWRLFADYMNNEQLNLMNAIYEYKTSQIPYLPGNDSIMRSYLDELNKKNIIRKMGPARYSLD